MIQHEQALIGLIICSLFLLGLGLVYVATGEFEANMNRGLTLTVNNQSPKVGETITYRLDTHTLDNDVLINFYENNTKVSSVPTVDGIAKYNVLIENLDTLIVSARRK